MVCSGCGRENKEGVNFCTGCGTNLKTVVQETEFQKVVKITIGLILAVLAIIVGFQNGNVILGVRLLFWEVRTSQGFIIVGSTIIGIFAGILMGNFFKLRAKDKKIGKTK